MHILVSLSRSNIGLDSQMLPLCFFAHSCVKIWVYKLLTGDSVTSVQKIAMIWLSRNYHLNIIANQLLFMLLVPRFQSTRSLSWSWTRIFINEQYCGSDICFINQLTRSCLSCSEATDFSQATERFSNPRKKKLLLFLFFFPQSTVFLWSKLKCFGVPAGLLATVPVNPHDGTNRSNVGRVNTCGSSENLSMLGGTSRTGL